MLLPKESTMMPSSNQGACITRGPGSPRMSKEETNIGGKKCGTKWPETAEMRYVNFVYIPVVLSLKFSFR